MLSVFLRRVRDFSAVLSIFFLVVYVFSDIIFYAFASVLALIVAMGVELKSEIRRVKVQGGKNSR